MESAEDLWQQQHSEKKKKKKKNEDGHTLPFIGIDPSSSKLLPSRRHEVFQLLAVAAIAVVVAFSCNLATTHLLRFRNKPFCDDFQISDLCDPCPDNAISSEGKWHCVHGYRKDGRLCVEDGEISQTARKLSKWILHHICGARAQFMCTGSGKTWFKQGEIINMLDGYKFPDLGSRNNLLVLAKKQVMDSLPTLLETKTSYDGSKELQCPDSLAENYKPIPCIIHEWIFKHVLFLVAGTPMVVAFLRFLWKKHQNRKLSERAEQLYVQVCEALEETAMMAKDMGMESESYVVASRLRDHLLSPNERKNNALWKKVEALVQEDSRLDQYQKLIKGEPKVVWEWQVEGSLSNRMKRKSSRTAVTEQGAGLSHQTQRKLQICVD